MIINRNIGMIETFHVEVSGVPARLHPSVIHEVVSIGSEALRNAFRHACAKHIRLHFRYEAEEFRLAVVDDGTGIDPTILAKGRGEGHFGLVGMRERAKIVRGELVSWSELGVGTRIELKLSAMDAYIS